LIVTWAVTTAAAALARCSRVQYKLAVTVLQCLQNRAPKYLVDYCIPVSDVANRPHFTLRQSTLDITRMCRATDEAHSVAGPCLLGPDDPERTILGLLVYLPDDLRDPSRSVGEVPRILKNTDSVVHHNH